jgi:hypothetical protein
MGRRSASFHKIALITCRVVTPLPTPATHRQQRPNPSPRHIGQLTTSHHQRMINERWSNDSQDTP